MSETSESSSIGSLLSNIADIVVVLVVAGLLAGLLLILLIPSGATTPGEFTVVDLEPSDTTVDEFESVDVSATIKNTGDSTETRNVRITLGQAEKELSLTLDPGESETIWLRGVKAESLGVGETAFRIQTGYDQQSATLTVDSQRPPDFVVSDLQPDSATLADEETQFTVSAKIENVGGQSGEEIVKLHIGNDTYYQTSVALDPGESDRFVLTNMDLRWLQPGDHSYAISTANDRVQGSIYLPEPATFKLRDVDARSGTLNVDEPVTVSFSVENTGDFAAEETVELVVGEKTLQTETVTLESGASTTVAFEDIDPTHVGIGLHRYHLRVGDATESGTWVIEGDEPDHLEITSLEPRSVTVEKDGSFDIAATIENTGEQTGNHTVELRFDGVTRYEETIVLPPGERTDFDIDNLSLAGIPEGEYEYLVRTNTGEQTGRVLIVGGNEDSEEDSAEDIEGYGEEPVEDGTDDGEEPVEDGTDDGEEPAEDGTDDGEEPAEDGTDDGEEPAEDGNDDDKGEDDEGEEDDDKDEDNEGKEDNDKDENSKDDDKDENSKDDDKNKNGKDDDKNKNGKDDDKNKNGKDDEDDEDDDKDEDDEDDDKDEDDEDDDKDEDDEDDDKDENDKDEE